MRADSLGIDLRGGALRVVYHAFEETATGPVSWSIEVDLGHLQDEVARLQSRNQDASDEQLSTLLLDHLSQVLRT